MMIVTDDDMLSEAARHGVHIRNLLTFRRQKKPHEMAALIALRQIGFSAGYSGMAVEL